MLYYSVLFSLTESGALEGLNKLTNRLTSMQSQEFSENDDIEREQLLSKRESSHEYDWTF